MLEEVALLVERPEARGVHQLSHDSTDDNDGTSPDSQLDYVPNHSGTYYLDASSATQSGTGNYTLSATQRQETDIPSSAASTSRRWVPV